MSELWINPEDLRIRARELERMRQDHLDIMRQLRILVESLSESWSGEAQTAFYTMFMANSNCMDTFSNSLSKFIEVADEAAFQYEKMDDRLKTSVHNARNT